MPGATSAKGSTSSGAIQPRCAQQAEGQHQAQHRHRRDHRVGMGHGAHQRAREGGEGAGETVDRLAIAAMRATTVAEGLTTGMPLTNSTVALLMRPSRSTNS